MKFLLIVLVTILSINAFAQESNFQNMSVEELFERGFAIEATVTQEIGIRFDRAERVYRNKKNQCIVILSKNAEQDDSILRKGKKAIFTEFESQRYDINFIASKTDLIKAIMFVTNGHYHNRTLGSLIQSCGELFSFSVIENPYLQDIN